jgi:hypothetical protein
MAVNEKNQNAAALDSGLHLMAAGLSNSPTNRAALIQGSSGVGKPTFAASDIINMNKAEVEQHNARIRKGALPALMKQYGWTPAQAQALEAGGKLDEVLQHYATENLAQVKDEDGRTHLIAPRSGKIISTLGTEKEDPTQLADTPLGKQIVNMRTGETIGTPLGPTDANVDAKGTKFPTPDKGFDYARDEKGLVKLTNGVPTVAALPGSPAEKEQIDAAQKKVEQKMQSAATLANISNAADNLEKHVGWGSTGLGSKLMQKTVGQLGGTSTNLVQDELDTIRSNVSFEKLAAMRAASQTGGALGNVSDFENKLLASSVNSITANHSAEDVMKGVRRVQAYTELMNKKVYTDEATFRADLEKRTKELLEKGKAQANAGVEAKTKMKAVVRGEQ